MYKVFVNDKVIYFTNNAQLGKDISRVLVLHFFQPSLTPLLLELLENDSKTDTIIVNVSNVEQAFLEFKEYFKLILAAGGVVLNAQEELLVINRLGKWDLPKGKVEAGEGIEEGAIREVEEECGISGLSVQDQLDDTYHIYKLKDEVILKQTFWFKMVTEQQGGLCPQTEEGITEVKWMDQIQLTTEFLSNTYASIRDLIKTNFPS